MSSSSTRHGLYIALLSAFAAFGTTGCLASDETGDWQTDDAEDSEVVAESAEPIVVLAVDVTESMNRGLFGKKKDYVYNVGGKYTSHTFSLDTHGNADAYIVSIDDSQVKVHAWADAYSGYTFTLKVWADK